MSNKIKVSDFLWNFGSTAILAVGGFILSAMIATVYSPDVLGVFNESYAYYIVLSQIAVLGIHTATLKYTAENSEYIDKKQDVFGTAILSGIIVSFTFSLFVLVVLCFFVKDEQFANSMKYVVCALPFFTLNKIFMGFLNGDKKMKPFAVLQAGRIVAMVLFLAIFIAFKYLPYELTVIFFCAEISVFLISACYFIYIKKFHLTFNKRIAVKITRFGMQIFPGNIVAEFNTKIDVICLGLITNDDFIVGIYSFATLFAEGMYQMYMIIRKLVNPYLTEEYYKHKDIKKLIDDMEKRIRFTRTAFSVILLIGVNVVFYVICNIFNQTEYLVGSTSLILLSLSIALTSKSIIYGNIFGQTGLPINESKINIYTMITNLVLNLILIPLYGMVGAAIATAVSYILFAVYQKNLIKKLIVKER